MRDGLGKLANEQDINQLQGGGPVVHPITQWKRDFLARRDLDYATGRPLYTYRVTTDEFNDLECILRERLATYFKVANLGDIARRIDVFPALFVLYAAEWWRRRYDGTGFSWDPILHSIGAPPDGWNQAQRSDCVDRGFQEWKLRLSDSHGLRFLGSIAFQGGLPMQLLGSARGNIGRVLSRVLQLASTGTFDIREIQEWVKSLSTYLPNSYRQTEVYVLLTEVVVTVLRLKEVAGLTESASAIERLDQKVPNWRDSFPLPVEDDQARGLIEQLVRDAAGRVSKQVQHISVERRIEQNSDETWSLRSNISLPEYLDVTILTSLFSVDAQDLTRTPTLRFVRSDSVTDIPLRKLAGQERYRVDRRPLDCRGDAAAAEHAMQLLTSAGQVHYKEIPRGSVLEEELPWVFDESADGSSSYRLARLGSGGITSIHGVICAPTNWKIISDEGVLLEPRAKLRDGARFIWAIHGVVRAEAPDGLFYKIRCGQATACNDQFELRGSRVWDTFTQPDLAFHGIPRLFHILETGLEQPVQGALAWRTQGADRTSASDTVFGPVTAHWPAQGEPKWRSRLVLLPQTADIITQPGDDVSTGMLRFSHWKLLAVDCESPDVDCSVTTDQDSLVATVSYRGQGSPPEWLALRGWWRGNPAQARFRVPFPAKGVRAIGPGGQHLDNDTLLTVGQTIGVRLIAFLGDSHRAELRLGLHRGNHANPANQIVQTIRVVSGETRAEVRLVDYTTEIQRLLASADVLDAHVSARLKLSTGESLTLRIARYALELARDNSQYQVRLPQERLGQLSVEEVQGLPILAVRIDSPGEEPIPLAPVLSEGVPTGSWEFPATTLPPGPWLIYPGSNAQIVFRPMLWPISSDDNSVTGLLSLAEVPFEADQRVGLTTALGFSLERDRVAALDAAITRLAEDFVDRDWILVEQLVGLLGHLPLSTLDLWRRFSHSPSGMAALAIRISGIPSTFAERFPNELPFVWETIPLPAWVQAMRAASEQATIWYGQDAGTTVLSSHLEKRIQGLASSCPSLRVLLEAARAIAMRSINHEMGLAQQALMDRIFAAQLFDGENSRLQQLLRNNSDGNWPAAFSDEISSVKKNGCAAFLCPDNYGFHDSVINAPIYLAICASQAFPVSLEQSDKVIGSIRKIQSFDLEWFTEAFDLTIARCISVGAIKLC